MNTARVIEVPIAGMDCAECALRVQHAIKALPNVESVAVLLAAEKAVVQLKTPKADFPAIRQAVGQAGYSVPASGGTSLPATAPAAAPLGDFTQRVLGLFGLVFGAVLFIVVAGEWLGLFEARTECVPWPLGLGVVLAAGYPVFANVVRAALRQQITAHTLMTLGVLAAMVVSEWATAAVVVFFMRVGDYAESFTTERARRAVKDLAALALKTARVERDWTR